MNFLKVKKWIPFTKISPLNTFSPRLINKIFFITQLIASKIGFRGAKVITKLSDGNYQVKLNNDSNLGKKGTIINLPKDNVIFEYVKIYGFWAKNESQFLSKALQTAHNSPQTKVALIDIGANVGLVTLSTMNLSKTLTDIHLFEPVPIHASALKHNLKNLIVSGEVFVNEFGLGSKPGRKIIYRDKGNSGNSSVFNTAVGIQNREEIEISLMSAERYFEDNLKQYEKLILKSDIQGLDAEVLSNFPAEFWNKVEAAVIEVWAFIEIKSDEVADFIAKISSFGSISWDPNFQKRTTFKEVEDFWFSKNNQQRNLYLSKKPQT